MDPINTQILKKKKMYISEKKEHMTVDTFKLIIESREIEISTAVFSCEDVQMELEKYENDQEYNN